MRIGQGASKTYSAQYASGDGILKLPSRLQRDLILLFAIKLAMLGLLYLLCFSPSHRPTINTMAHVTGQLLN